MLAPRTPEQWGLDTASPALEPIMHLALGELSTECQLAAERYSGLADAPLAVSEFLGEAAQPGSDLRPQGDASPAALLLLSQLALLAMEAAHMGALSLQRLIGCGVDLVEVRPAPGRPADSGSLNGSLMTSTSG